MTSITKYNEKNIGPLPLEWKVERFDSVFEFLSTHSFSRENLTEEKTHHNIQNIHYGDIHSKFENEILDCSTQCLPYIKDEMIINQSFNFIKDGDLIIADASEDYEGIGECIEIKNVGDKTIVGGLHTFLARDFSNKTIAGFRTYIFNNPKVSLELKKVATGTSVYSISKNSLRKLLLPIPPKTEQHKIGIILSTWDVAIDKTTKIQSELKKRKKGLVIEFLSRRKGFAINGNNSLIKTKGFVIPKNWKVVPMSKLVKQIKKPITPEKEILYKQIGIRSHAKGIFYKEAVSGLSLGNKSVFKIEPDCFIVNIVFAWEHAIAKTTVNEIEMIASHRFPMYKPIKEELDLDYLLHFFKSKKGKDLLGLASPGGAGRNKTLGQSEFLKLQIPVPPINEQRKIAACLDKVDEEISLFERKLSELKIQKKGLMQQLLTGKIRVQV